MWCAFFFIGAPFNCDILSRTRYSRDRERGLVQTDRKSGRSSRVIYFGDRDRNQPLRRNSIILLYRLFRQRRGYRCLKKAQCREKDEGEKGTQKMIDGRTNRPCM